MEQISSTRCFDGQQLRYRHASDALQCDMTFSIFLPGLAKRSVPVVYWLSGLTCNDENFVQKAGAQRIANELGIAIVTPDTSPRGEDVPDDPEGAYDFGLGAGFYLNATQAPYHTHYQMYDYIHIELPALIEANFSVDPKRQSIFGHSMGGHGALTIALKHPDQYRSVSAFAPICSPINCPWGQKALSQYLGADQAQWQAYDTVSLVSRAPLQIPMMIDQGTDDEFLAEQLNTELLKTACDQANHPLTLNMRKGYDHSYFFISSFIEEHLRFHAQYLFD